jgi:hypothetical protein
MPGADRDKSPSRLSTENVKHTFPSSDPRSQAHLHHVDKAAELTPPQNKQARHHQETDRSTRSVKEKQIDCPTERERERKWIAIDQKLEAGQCFPLCHSLFPPPRGALLFGIRSLKGESCSPEGPEYPGPSWLKDCSKAERERKRHAESACNRSYCTGRGKLITDQGSEFYHLRHPFGKERWTGRCCKLGKLNDHGHLKTRWLVLPKTSRLQQASRLRGRNSIC